MTNVETVAFVRLIAGLYAVQMSKTTDEMLADMVDAYSLGLADLDAADATRALQRLAMTSRFPPTVAEIREDVVTLKHGRRRTGLDAWADVNAAIREWGQHDVHGGLVFHPGDDFEFVDPLVATIVDRLGWRDLVDSDNRVSDRARFIAEYDDAVAEMRRTAAQSPGATSAALAGATSSKPTELVGGTRRPIAALPPGMRKKKGSP